MKAVLKFLIVVVVFGTTNLNAQIIQIDEDFNDWQDKLVYADQIGDGSSSGLDLEHLWLSSDEKFLYVSFELDKEIILQDYPGLRLLIDTDNNTSTGLQTAGIGADLDYEFYVQGTQKAYIDGWSYFLDHEDIQIATLPTVSSSRFELKIQRTSFVSGNTFALGDTIRVALKDNFFDQLPSENGGIIYALENEAFVSDFSLEKVDDSDIRIMSYNVEQDGYFENGSRQAINRLLRATQPDIIAFQEIYDHTAAETEVQVASALNVPSDQLYSQKIFPDIILVSKFPITDVATAGGTGNGAFKVEDGSREWLIINAHLPCCENNDGREEEIEKILLFIEDVKQGNANISIADNSPILVVGDMNFVGFASQPQSFIDGINEGPDWNGIMEDANPKTTGEPANFTWYNEFSSFAPGRLDYVFYSGSVLKVKNSFNLFTPSISTQILDQYQLEMDDTVAASDHLPVVVDFDRDKLSSVNFANQDLDFTAFPNPCQDRLNLEGAYDRLELFDTRGTKLLDLKIQTSSLDLSRFASGIYLLKVTTNSNIIFRQIFKD